MHGGSVETRVEVCFVVLQRWQDDIVAHRVVLVGFQDWEKQRQHSIEHIIEEASIGVFDGNGRCSLRLEWL